MADRQLASYAVDSHERGFVVYERDDPELTAIAVCMTALRDLDANAAARVAAYVAERHLPVAMTEEES